VRATTLSTREATNWTDADGCGLGDSPCGSKCAIDTSGCLPVDIDLSDTCETLTERAQRAGTARAHERVQVVMRQALVDAEQQGWRWTPTIKEGDEE
jgi:hypothetical protein